MGLRDMLRRKDDDDQEPHRQKGNSNNLDTPDFVFIRSDTTTQEYIQPPHHPDHDHLSAAKEPSLARRSLDVFRPRSRSRSGSAASSQAAGADGPASPRRPRRVSEVLHLNRAPDSSEYVPTNLPEIQVGSGDAAQDESQWESRAMMLAGQSELVRSRPSSSVGTPRTPSRPPSRGGAVSSKEIDEDIQEAIRLHEEGDLLASSRIFGRLADPNGANNPLSQVLYGLALRHGWGVAPDPAGAVRYLTAALSSSASIEELALKAGLKKGGAAKGELVLAIFELANCFRHGWGINKDPVAAKQYYETAANLGDADAMNEVAWCYLEGHGCKKDKYAAARYYRMAEKAGNKTIGNSWIWKEKYDGNGKK
ncbi:unnamed protein product [Clonostachys byssicola]|uniref:Protein DSF2 n=1 Tax=Clonostachys byssicola TaxID=160290 RepID=A0A9N9XUX7_9HYPO|nr:unnamed protein product [Clonostachys byssicola]